MLRRLQYTAWTWCAVSFQWFSVGSGGLCWLGVSDQPTTVLGGCHGNNSPRRQTAEGSLERYVDDSPLCLCACVWEYSSEIFNWLLHWRFGRTSLCLVKKPAGLQISLCRTYKIRLCIKYYKYTHQKRHTKSKQQRVLLLINIIWKICLFHCILISMCRRK